MNNPATTDKCLKCGLCCVFTREQAVLAPFFSKKEIEAVGKAGLVKNGQGMFQAKTLGSKKGKGFRKCYFLDDGERKCTIYDKRPADCYLWPFIVGWDEKKKDVYLWICDSSFCPAASKDYIIKIRRSPILVEIVNELKKDNFFKEIKSGERPLWPYEKYQIKLKKITSLIF